MCGRFAVTLPPDAMAQLFEASPANALPDLPNYNVCPTNHIHVVTSDGDARRLVSMRWGFLPQWYKTTGDGPLLINARAETIVDKPAFKAAAISRRCLIPADGFYEWTKDSEGNRLPWYIAPPKDEPLVFAGIWQEWTKGDDPMVTCAIVTCKANPKMATLHARMPVVLSPDAWALWLGEAGHGAATLMRAAPEEALAFHRVNTEVNSNRSTGPELRAPIDPL